MFRFRSKKNDVSISIAQDVLEAIYDECDRYDVDETGGRIVGTYKLKGAHYDIQVMGMLGPGPNADRSPTSFFQDGEHQEKMFRAIEAKYPDIEHLGNWHTHHVNGYPTLSGGDKTTYFKTVNHHKHNTDFFYALLVVKKNARGNPRYDIKHFFFHRNDDTVYEIPHSKVKVVNAPALSARESIAADPNVAAPVGDGGPPYLERVKDQEFFSEFYPDLKALSSKSSGAPYWKGTVELVDGSRALIVVMENGEAGKPAYSITAAGENPVLADIKSGYKNRNFRSARHAVIQLERDLNQAIHKSSRGAKV
jgi:proteasome lid subunit RPN8/RPN11